MMAAVKDKSSSKSAIARLCEKVFAACRACSSINDSGNMVKAMWSEVESFGTVKKNAKPKKSEVRADEDGLMEHCFMSEVARTWRNN